MFRTTLRSEVRQLVRLSGLLLLLGLLAPAEASVSVTRAMAYDYDAQGRLIKEVVEPGGTAEECLATDHGYDARGNRSTDTVRECVSSEGSFAASSSAGYFAPRTTTTTWGDAQMRFPTSVQNPAGHVETRSFDARFGTPASITAGLLASDAGQIGLTTSFGYDGFGRLTSQIKPEGATATYSYQLCSTSGACTAAATTAGAVYVLRRDENYSSSPTAPSQWVYYDALHREVLSETQGAASSGTPPLIYVKKTYDTQARVLTDSRPYFAGQPIQTFGPTQYDLLNRVKIEITANGKQQTYGYTALVTTLTNEKSQTTTKRVNSQGWLMQINDAIGGQVWHYYEPFGSLRTSIGYDGTTGDDNGGVNITYDKRGRKKTFLDPSLGYYTYTYNALGELLTQTDSKNVVQSFQYDVLSRMKKRLDADLIGEWSYDKNFDGSRCQYGVGQICQSKADNGYLNTQSFDAAGRPSSATTQMLGTVFTVGTTFVPGTIRVASKTYPTGLNVLYSYTAQGYATQVRNATGEVYWDSPTRDAEGHVILERYGNNVYTTTTYDPRTGLFTGVQAGPGNIVQDLRFVWERETGNLLVRQDNNQSLIETFSYDQLNRITQSLLNSGAVSAVTTSFAYDGFGNLRCKSDLSTCAANNPNYSYGMGIYTPSMGDTRDAPGMLNSIRGTVHGVTNPTFSYDANGNMTAGMGRTISYTSFNMPLTIAKSGYSATFTYGPDHQRVQQVDSGTGVTPRTVVYLNPDQANGLLYERETFGTTTYHRHYITAQGVVIGQVVRQYNGDGSASQTTQYFHRDNLGSVTAVTDSSGAVLERTAYDAWGKRRFANGVVDPGDTIHGDPNVHNLTDRGYTNHEMLDALGMIHMNGRVFDPVIARFVTPDPTVPNPDWLQSHTRFAYVQNNPFTETDPTGFAGEAADSDGPVGDHDPNYVEVEGGYLQCSGCGKGGKDGPVYSSLGWGKSGWAGFGEINAEGKTVSTSPWTQVESAKYSQQDNASRDLIDETTVSNPHAFSFSGYLFAAGKGRDVMCDAGCGVLFGSKTPAATKSPAATRAWAEPNLEAVKNGEVSVQAALGLMAMWGVGGKGYGIDWALGISASKSGFSFTFSHASYTQAFGGFIGAGPQLGAAWGSKTTDGTSKASANIGTVNIGTGAPAFGASLTTAPEGVGGAKGFGGWGKGIFAGSGEVTTHSGSFTWSSALSAITPNFK